MYDVFFYEAFEEEAAALRRHLPADMRAGFTWKAIQEEHHAQPPAPVISIRTQSALPHAWARGLQAIITRSTGYDHVREYLHATGAALPCGYLPLYCNRAVAEHALMLWLALRRKLPHQMEQFQRFHRDGITGGECAGATLAVVGVGNIGHEVVKIGRGLEMNVVGVDIVQRHAGVKYVPRDEALAAADIIVCAMNLTRENSGYFGGERLRCARRGAIFVNIARGEFSPAADLLRLLDDGHLGGVGLDVYAGEKALAVALRRGERDLADDNMRAVLELARRPNAILTPHNAFNTHEAVERKSQQSVEQVLAFRATGAFTWPVPL